MFGMTSATTCNGMVISFVVFAIGIKIIHIYVRERNYREAGASVLSNKIFTIIWHFDRTFLLHSGAGNVVYSASPK